MTANETVQNLSQNMTSQGIQIISSVDPNWLYSSLAQSSAAIVGLMGAFLTTKIINQQARNHVLRSQILEHKTTIKTLKKNIAPKIEYVKTIDQEDAEELVDNFLGKIKTSINVENPPKIDELLELAKSFRDEEFVDIDVKLLRQKYNKQYLDGARNYQTNRSLFSDLELPKMPDISRPVVIKRYNEYSEEIEKTHNQIELLEKLVKEKEAELLDVLKNTDMKATFVWLGIFSFVGVVVPLFVLTTDLDTMYELRTPILALATLGWMAILIHLGSEMKSVILRR